jgi:hypothetical protein
MGFMKDITNELVHALGGTYDSTQCVQQTRLANLILAPLGAALGVLVRVPVKGKIVTSAGGAFAGSVIASNATDGGASCEKARLQ